MTDLNSLAVFAKVAEANSFSEAARHLKMPISTVSRRIAELEDQLGVRLLERSTHSLRLTDIGAEILEHARRSAELNQAVENIVSNQLSVVSGTLRLSAPPSISDTLLAPLVCAFQASYPNVRVHILVTDRFVDHIAEGVDLAFRLGEQNDSSLVARKVLTRRHRLVASPEYLKNRKAPEIPRDLLDHRLLAFSHRMPETSWHFVHENGREEETLTFRPYLSMNDFATGEQSTEGRIVIDQRERRWSFTPTSPWAAGYYHVRVASSLEDVCGNSVIAAFDRPLRSGSDLAYEVENRSIPFQLI